MQGKVVVITGGTSGIGQVSAERLAAMGARIVLVARSKNRGEADAGAIAGGCSRASPSHSLRRCFSAGRLNRLAAEMRAAEPRIDVLINNAGAMFGQRQVTEDGLELTLATNHVSYFVLTHGLREQLAAAGSARIINTSSHAHHRGQVDFDDLQYQRNYKSFPAYCRSKLCNVLFTRSLAKRLAGSGVTTNSLHPGFVNTRFADESGGWTGRTFGFLKMFAISPEKGAETIIYLASSADVATTSGRYFYKCKAVEPSKLAQDEAAAERLWSVTARLAGIQGW